jgi:hypothetical protein
MTDHTLKLTDLQVSQLVCALEDAIHAGDDVREFAPPDAKYVRYYQELLAEVKRQTGLKDEETSLG